MLWVGKDFKVHPLGRDTSPYPKLSKPCPGWPWTLPGCDSRGARGKHWLCALIPWHQTADTLLLLSQPLLHPKFPLSLLLLAKPFLFLSPIPAIPFSVKQMEMTFCAGMTPNLSEQPLPGPDHPFHERIFPKSNLSLPWCNLRPFPLISSLFPRRNPHPPQSFLGVVESEGAPRASSSAG